MLRTTRVDLSVMDLGLVGGGRTIDEVCNGEILGARVDTGMASLKSKTKISIKYFVAKFQSFAQSSESDFLSLRAGLAFIKLR